MRARIAIVGMGLLCLMLSQWAHAELYNDGGVHNLVSGWYDQIDVDNPPPPAPTFTTVNLGGTASAYRLEAFNHSQVTMNGTWLYNGLSAHGHSQVTMDDAHVINELSAYDNSRLTMNGGYADQISAYDNSRMTTNGAETDGFVAYGNSRVTLNQISTSFFAIHDNSRVTMTGGYVFGPVDLSGSSRMTISGGYIGWELFAGDSSKVTFVGSDFAIYGYDEDGIAHLVFSGYGDLPGSFFNSFSGSVYGFSLSGTLANGDPLDGLLVGAADDARVSFVPVPGAVLLGTIGLGVAGWRLRRKTC